MKTATDVISAATNAVIDEREPVMLLKRIGSTTYRVAVRFSAKGAETLEDKIFRMIESEVTDNARCS